MNATKKVDLEPLRMTFQAARLRLARAKGAHLECAKAEAIARTEVAMATEKYQEAADALACAVAGEPEPEAVHAVAERVT